MTRAEFISKLFLFTSIALLIYVLVLRIINTEKSLAFALPALFILFPYWLIVLSKCHSLIFVLHRNMHTRGLPYRKPSFFSPRLIPQCFLVVLLTILPPVLFTSLVFGVANHPQEHTTELSCIFLMFLIVAWYFCIVQPLFSRSQIGSNKLNQSGTPQSGAPI